MPLDPSLGSINVPVSSAGSINTPENARAASANSEPDISALKPPRVYATVRAPIAPEPEFFGAKDKMTAGMALPGILIIALFGANPMGLIVGASEILLVVMGRLIYDKIAEGLNSGQTNAQQADDEDDNVELPSTVDNGPGKEAVTEAAQGGKVVDEEDSDDPNRRLTGESPSDLQPPSTPTTDEAIKERERLNDTTL